MGMCVSVLRKRSGSILSLVFGENGTIKRYSHFSFCISVLFEFSTIRMLTPIKKKLKIVLFVEKYCFERKEFFLYLFYAKECSLGNYLVSMSPCSFSLSSGLEVFF